MSVLEQIRITDATAHAVVSQDRMISPAQMSDITELLEVEKIAWGDEGANELQIASRIKTFPLGNPVIRVRQGSEWITVGWVSLMRLEVSEYADITTWDTTTSRGCITNHNPQGKTIFGVNASARGGHEDVLTDLVNYVTTLGRAWGCQEILLGSRAPGFTRWKKRNSNGTFEAYFDRRRSSGRSADPEAYLYEMHGFFAVCGLEDYFPCEESGDWGILMRKPL